MPVSFISNELQLSGSVTNAEWHSAVGGGGLSYNNHNIYQLEADIRLLSGCDLSGFGDVIIELNAHDFRVDSGVIDAIWRNVTFIESGPRIVADRFVFKSGTYQAQGGSFINNVEGVPSSGSDPRYMMILEATSLSNVSLFTTKRPITGFDALNITKSGIYSDVGARRINRIIAVGSGVRPRFRRWHQTSTTYAKALLGVYSGASLMVEGGSNSGTGSSQTWLDNYNGQINDHWLYLLGSANARFATTNINKRKNQLHIVGGGMQYRRFVGGEGGKVYYYDSRSSSSPQEFLPVTDRAEMLSTARDVTLGSDEQVEIVVTSYLFNAANGWTKEQLTGQKIIYLKYDKEILVIDAYDDRENVVGSENAFVPTVVGDDALISEHDEAIVNGYTTQETPYKAYDHLKVLLMDNHAGEDAPHVTRSGATLITDFDVIIDGTGSGAPSFDGTTITLNATTFTGNLITAGTITFQNGATIDGSYQGANGVLVSATAPADAWTKITSVDGATVHLAATQSSSATTHQVQMPANTDFRLTIKQRDRLPYRATHNSGTGVSLAPTMLSIPNYNTSFDISSPTDYTGYWTPAYDSATGKLTLTINQAIGSPVSPPLAAKNLFDHVLTSQAGIDFLAAQGLGLYSFTSQSIKVDETKFDFVRNSSLLTNAAQTSLNVINSSNATFVPSDSNVFVPGTAQVFEVPQPTLEAASTAIAAASYAKFTQDDNADAFKADTSNLSIFDPASDTVAHVTLVDTVTTNTDMRGTDDANTRARASEATSDLLVEIELARDHARAANMQTKPTKTEG